MGSGETFVFGYASLVDPKSASSTLGHDVAPDRFQVARLTGWRRAWNVGSDRTSHPERTFVRADGSEFTGVTAVLGLTPADGDVCTGAVLPVSTEDLARLDVRERNYDRVDVTGLVTWAGAPRSRVVFAYVPRPVATARLRAAVADGREVNVRAGYVRLVEAAFTALGLLAQYRRSTPAVPFPVEDLAIRIDPGRTGPGPAPATGDQA
jgi:cation transport regulator ChaC